MDRFRKLTIIIFFLLISFSSFGQCDSTLIKKENVNGCVIVSMSAERFTEFYKSKKNLELIKLKLPEIESQIDSLQKLNRQIGKNYDSQIDSLNIQKQLLLRELRDCMHLTTDLGKENSSLKVENSKLKRQRNIFVGTTAVSVMIIALSLIIGN